MRFGFVSCVQLGLSCMEAIYDVGGSLDLAITLEDDMARAKSGRVYLDDFAERHAIDLVKVRNINESRAIAAVESHALDWLFIVGWSQIARAINAPRSASVRRLIARLPATGVVRGTRLRVGLVRCGAVKTPPARKERRARRSIHRKPRAASRSIRELTQSIPFDERRGARRQAGEPAAGAAPRRVGPNQVFT